jgi:cell wall-associated NlpC family hydrolase
MRYLIVSFLVAILSSFRLPVKVLHSKITKFTYTTAAIIKNHVESLSYHVDTIALQFVDYAKTLIGTPYVWGSVNPEVGVDCSGFVNYVAHHFDITVPRTAAEFATIGSAVNLADAKTGDLILFKGRNLKKRRIGHMGIVTDNADGHLNFIQSSSGHKKGVHISELQGYYKTRLVKIVRIFPVAGNKMQA